jgi:hypothetical protein
LFIETEKVFDTLAVALEKVWAIAEVNGAIQLGVSFDESGRHCEWVIKVSERLVGECFAHF